MEHKQENQPDPEDELKAENELLKLKLELEHGMKDMGASGLSSEAENQWLNYIYNFEKLHKNAKRIKVFEALGQPHYIKPEALSKAEVGKELERILNIMEEKNIALSWSGDYEDIVIYKFITEELFEQEMDDIFMPGMVSQFIYEEFHPNHDDDLRRYTHELIEALFKKKWDRKYSIWEFHKTISFKGKEYDCEGISDPIIDFQEAYHNFQIRKTEIEEVDFDLERAVAMVRGRILYTAYSENENRDFDGKFVVNFILDYDCWCISGFSFPGFGD